LNILQSCVSHGGPKLQYGKGKHYSEDRAYVELLTCDFIITLVWISTRETERHFMKVSSGSRLVLGKGSRHFCGLEMVKVCVIWLFDGSTGM